MELKNLKAHELKKLINKKELSVEEIIREHLKVINSIDSKVGAFLYVSEKEAIEKARKIDEKIAKNINLGILGGIPLGVKDNINVKGIPNTCGSKILKEFISPYDATVIEKIKKQDGIILGKLNMDEFGMGSSTENSAFKLSKNPWNLNKVPGGSSGGSAAAVSSLEVPIALGTETGGSVRQPAAFCGLVGIKPTYGRVSRSGVVAFGSTLDQVGTMARDVEDCALLLEVISGLDKYDSTTVDIKVPNYLKFLKEDLKGIKIGVPKEFFSNELDENIKKLIYNGLEVLKENGAEIRECSFSLSDYSLATYYIISSAEASSNLARFDGIKYGYRDDGYKDLNELYIKSRSYGFGDEVKKRIIIGNYVLSSSQYDEYYNKALKIRSLIINEFKNIFKEFDAIIAPTTPTTAFNIGEKSTLDMYLSDIYTTPVNVAGIPAITVPCGFLNNLPVGMQLIGNYFKEDILFNIAYSYEKSTNWNSKYPNL
ncbi:Asp-tRNA(Asn)/Glu-tRNA(Gln) amidotransferase subunit GatA [Clostridium fallax]|uniref:Glutamyl-tRNA(Gln) amidotransferase subunit A n=1 Tax=Clostridium fallax TaxID=1533 RepID=A0A1M4YY39_9CLOT|nr:Asp-tRNA(Asn)/Glu-tRNA(Gln) amidotransferase subunit GatA [Clostridium fallax]SHF10256.1 aspartyl/glutamyl-tRNA(Asn/Gln) amidotransferase subunit A [Clostridium fallax]SQB22276.1 aspartyl/glutamyl-tRNA amidotransferase subunit A [Clostridium fallax]